MTRSTTPSTLLAPASLARRAGAYAIDITVQSVLLGVAGGGTAAVVIGLNPPATAEQLFAAAAAVYGVVFVVALGWVLVYTAMQGGRGSIGQRLLGLRLADAETGATIGFGRALLRNLVWGLAASIVVGYFSPLFDASPRRQGWHDKVARAYVGVAGSAVPEPVVEASSPVAEPAPEAVAAPTPVVGPPPRFTSAAVAPTASRTGAVPPVTPYGLISHVPGATPSAPEPAEAAPAVREREPAVREPVVREPVTRDAPPADDATVAAPPRRRAVAAFTWDTGERVAVYGTTLFGRNPSAEDGAAVVAVRDETLSLSKTHFEVGADAEGPWIVDRHSTNGSALVRDGVRAPLEPGVRVPLRPGDLLEFGDRRLHVGEAS